MLVIVSDLHLGDGTTASSIATSAFRLFSNRLRETAYYASFRNDGTYRPVEGLDLVLLGDILDPLHSTLWLDTGPADLDYTRPWTGFNNPRFAAKLDQTTQAILNENNASLDILRRCATGESILLPPANGRGQPDPESRERVPIKAHIHYLVGNHDWYYHIEGEAFNKVRRSVIDCMGLSNHPDNIFAYDLSEYPELLEVMEQHKVYARHGDCYDKFNYNPEFGRDHSALGDMFTMDICNRYPVEVQKRYGDDLPAGIIDGLRRITNVRPALATPLWISGQIKRHAGTVGLQAELKEVWDDLCDEFLQLEAVRQEDKAFQFDMVDMMEIALKISKRTSFETVNEVVLWVRDKLWGNKRSFAEHVLAEPAFLDGAASYFIYGHTHHYEIVPLDSVGEPPHGQNQMYFNSGTWHSYFDLAIKDPSQQEFIPYETLTYLTFYKDDERGGQRFETWSGAYA